MARHERQAADLALLGLSLGPRHPQSVGAGSNRTKSLGFRVERNNKNTNSSTNAKD